MSIVRRNSANRYDLNYKWIQTFGEIEVTIPLKAFGYVTQDDVHFHADENFIVVGIKSHQHVLHGNLYGKIKASNTVWVVKGRKLLINLTKEVRIQEWEKLIKEPDPDIEAPLQIPETKTTMHLKESTPLVPSRYVSMKLDSSNLTAPISAGEGPSNMNDIPDSNCLSPTSTSISTTATQNDKLYADHSINSDVWLCTSSTSGTMQCSPPNQTEESVCSHKIDQKECPHLNFTKWKAGQPIPSKCKQLIANVYLKIAHNNSTVRDKEILKMTSKLVGVGVSSINRIKTEYRECGKASTLGKQRPGRKGRYTRKQLYDDFTLCAIRRIVHNFFRSNEVPTVSKIARTINEDPELPKMSEATTNRILRDLNFAFIKKKGKYILFDRDDIIVWRRRYLRQMRIFRNENRHIVYLDETWVNEQHSNPKWQEDLNFSRQNDEKEGLKIGVKNTKSKASRLIVLHAGGASGFVPGCLRISCRETGSSYEGVDENYFLEWFTKALLPQLPPASVIVLDNASYHNVKRKPCPNASWLKENIQSWLTKHKIRWDAAMVKHELLQLAEPLRPACEEYVIDELAREAGHIVLRLPPYHCELTPIELVWAFIKEYVACNNKTQKIADVTKLTYEAFEKFTDDMWPKFIEHVVKMEHEMWELDELMENVADQLLINLNESDTSEDEQSSTEEMESV